MIYYPIMLVQYMYLAEQNNLSVFQACCYLIHNNQTIEEGHMVAIVPPNSDMGSNKVK